MNIYYSLCLFALAFACVLWGQIIFWKPGRFNRQNAAFLIMTAAAFLWAGSLAVLMLCSEEQSLFFANLSLLASNLMSTYIFIFVLTFFKKNLVYKIGHILVPVVAFLVWLWKYLGDATIMVQTKYGYFYEDPLCIENITFFAYNILITVLAVIIIIFLYRHVELKREKHCLLIWMWTDIIFALAAIVTAITRMYKSIPTDPWEGVIVCFMCVLYYHIAKISDMLDIPNEKIAKYITNNLTMPIVIADHTGTIVYCNSCYANLIHCAEKELIGKHYTQINLPKEFDVDGMLSDIKTHKQKIYSYSFQI